MLIVLIFQIQLIIIHLILMVYIIFLYKDQESYKFIFLYNMEYILHANYMHLIHFLLKANRIIVKVKFSFQNSFLINIFLILIIIIFFIFLIFNYYYFFIIKMS